MNVDYLIVGQGVAGSMLAWELSKCDKKVIIIDDDHATSSSMVSAGIINPVTGKRFALTEGFDRYFTCATQTYEELEKYFGETFFEAKPILRIFQDESERKHWQRKESSESATKYSKGSNKPGAFQPALDDTLGSVTISHTGFCHTTRLLNVFKKYFLERGDLVTRNFAYDDLQMDASKVFYNGNSVDTVIFCEGYRAQFNPWFSWVPFNSVKGEILRLQMDAEGLPDAVLNKGKWCAPLGKGEWAAGASYIWDELDCVPSEQGKNEIWEGLKKFIKRDICVINHQAAVRPVTFDQKVVLGRHPQFDHVAIFNGLGSKGFLTAPFYASHLADHLTAGHLVGEDVSVARFWPEKQPK